MVFQPSSLSPVWDSGYVNVTSAFVQSTCPEGPAQLFFRVFSLRCSDWVISVVTSSSSLVRSPSFSSSGPILRFYFRYCFFFGSKISVWFCLYIFCLCCDLLFFFVSDVFVLAHWNVLWWLLKSYLLILLSVSSQCWHYWSSFLFSLEIFLVPAMMRVFFF